MKIIEKILNKYKTLPINDRKKGDTYDSDIFMSINKRLGTKEAIKKISTFISIVLFFIGNYVINVLLNMVYDFKFQFGILNFFKIRIFTTGFFGIFLYLILFLGITLTIVVLSSKLRVYHADLNIGQKGTARWTTKEEIQEQYKGIPMSKDTFPGYGGIIISRIGELNYIDDSNTNNLCIGITRSGKGQMQILPTIENCLKKKKKMLYGNY